MGKRREYEAVVLSDKMQKTIVVKVTRMSKHAKYGKITKKYSKFKVHDEKNTAKTGDTVRIVETRPLSKDKRYRLKAVVKKARSYAQINPVRELLSSNGIKEETNAPVA